MMDRVGKMLGFEAEGLMLAVDDSILARDRAVEEIAAIELDAGLGGGDFQEPP